MGGLGGCDDLGHHWVVTTLGTCPYDNIDDDDDVDCLCFCFFSFDFEWENKANDRIGNPSSNTKESILNALRLRS